MPIPGENVIGRKDAKLGRPRVEENISDAILRIRKETGWGYTKIVQAMRRLGHNISRQTVKNVLVDAGLGPQPHDTPDTWSEFLKRHADTMWQCDFACKRKWTIKGMVDLYFLVFIHIGSRRIWVSPCTANPTGDWTTQQARNFDMFLQDENLRPAQRIQQVNGRLSRRGTLQYMSRSTTCVVRSFSVTTTPSTFDHSIPYSTTWKQKSKGPTFSLPIFRPSSSELCKRSSMRFSTRSAS